MRWSISAVVWSLSEQLFSFDEIYQDVSPVIKAEKEDKCSYCYYPYNQISNSYDCLIPENIKASNGAVIHVQYSLGTVTLVRKC